MQVRESGARSADAPDARGRVAVDAGGGRVARRETGTTRRFRRWLVGLGAVCLGFVFSQVAVANTATPDLLTFGSCLSEPGGESCGAPGYALEGPQEMALSPDGKEVYVGGSSRGISVVYRTSGGVLAFGSCVTLTGEGDSECSNQPGIASPEAVAVSSDGKNLYVANAAGDLAVMTRSTDGSLSALECIHDADNAASGCASGAPGMTLEAGAGSGLIVTPDGSHVYLATGDGGGSAGALDVFTRAADGELTLAQCFDSAAAPDPGASGCTAVPGLIGPGTEVITPSGYLFVGGYDDITSFEVQSNGLLAATGCFGTSTGCTQADVSGADESQSALTLTTDGRYLFAADNLDSHIVEFSVSGGSLTELGCVGLTAGPAGCATTVQSIEDPVAVALSPDGKALYTNSYDAVTAFVVGTDGSLVPEGCVGETGVTTGCSSSALGLAGVSDLLFTSDDDLLVTAVNGNSVASFARTPATAGSSTTTTGTSTNAAVRPVITKVSLSPATFRASGTAKLRLRLSEAATVRFAVKRIVLHFRGRPGANAFTVVLRKLKPLRPGRYVATVTASAAGATSAPTRLRLRVKR